MRHKKNESFATRAYKFRIYPSKAQEKQMNTHLWLSKNLWNELLAHEKRMYNNYGYFATTNALAYMTSKYGMYSQAQQSIAFRLDIALNTFLKRRKIDPDAGFPRFKTFRGMKSLMYPQSGFKLTEKLKVTPFGEIKIKRHREITGKIKTLSLKKEATGKWFAVFIADIQKEKPHINNGEKIGIDLGLKTFAALSNEIKIGNPRHLMQCEKKIADFERKQSRMKLHSKNYWRKQKRINVLHEKVTNSRKDFLHKTSTKLVKEYSLIALEKLSSKKMSQNDYGKQINDAGWGMFADMLSYKAESAGCKIMFVNPKDTTKTCSKCGNTQQMDLWQRTYECECGNKMDRDVNAALNILAKATIGTMERNACEDEAIASSMKQEATQFIGW
jgi:putative transposase